MFSLRLVGVRSLGHGAESLWRVLWFMLISGIYGMASGTAFGLIVGTVVTLGFLPILYVIMFRIPNDDSAGNGGFLGARRGDRTAERGRSGRYGGLPLSSEHGDRDHNHVPLSEDVTVGARDKAISETRPKSQPPIAFDLIRISA